MSEEKDKKSKLGLGLALLILGFLLILSRNSTTPTLSASFESEPVRIVNLEKNDSEEAELPKKIVIPKLSIDLPVEKSDVENGYWEVFEDKAGWGVGSGIPGEAGNQVIFAHAREGLFLPLQEVEQGMRIYVFTDNGWYEYEVQEIKEVFPNQTEVIEPTDDETLTLYTCSGFQDSKRLIVVAKRAE